jgi:hypothetical protein
MSVPLNKDTHPTARSAAERPFLSTDFKKFEPGAVLHDVSNNAIRTMNKW